MLQLRDLVLASLLILINAGTSAAPALQGQPRIPEQVPSADWEQDMRRFAALDTATPPPQRAVLFVGSSSIRLWETLAADFHDPSMINRDFGESELRGTALSTPTAPCLIDR